MSFFSKRSGPSKQDVLKFLNLSIPNKNWFIAGGSAIKGENYNDIDVFFLNEEAYTQARDALTSEPIVHNNLVSAHYKASETETNNAYNLNYSGTDIQLINRHFGTPEEIFETFDINVCKQAIMPNGRKVKHFTSYASPYIANVNYNTFRRYLKYLRRAGEGIDRKATLFSVIDKYIGDSSSTEEYYQGKKVSYVVNKKLFSDFYRFVESSSVKDYLKEKALEEAPELLL